MYSTVLEIVLKEDERNAPLAFKTAAHEAKDEVYEDLCANVN